MSPPASLQFSGLGRKNVSVSTTADNGLIGCPRVAIALASYNGAAFIRPQILSLLWQECCQITVFVRDDRSSDDTRGEVLRLAQQYPGQVILVDEDGPASGSAAQNFFRLLIALRGQAFDYLALADQDDIWEERKIARALEQLESRNADGYSSNLVAFSTDGGASGLLRKDHPPAPFDYLFQTASAGCTYVLTARLFETVASRLAANAPNPDIAHDILIYAIARSQGFAWVQDSAAHVLYRQHANNLVGSRNGAAGLRARWHLVRNGWYRRQTAMLGPYLANTEGERKIIAAVQSGRPADRLWLALRARRWRRRWREAIAFAALQAVP